MEEFILNDVGKDVLAQAVEFVVSEVGAIYSTCLFLLIAVTFFGCGVIFCNICEALKEYLDMRKYREKMFGKRSKVTLKQLNAALKQIEESEVTEK